MTSKMKVIDSNKQFADKMQPGAFIGATLVASGINKSVIIFHGYLGCNIESIHMRSDSIPGGFYTPIIATGLNELDSIYGGNEKLKVTLKQVLNKNFKLIWVLTGDATSITADDIYGVSESFDIPDDVNIIPLDVPGFLGGIAKGTDIAIEALLNLADPEVKKEDSVCLIAPHLMGIKSHPVDGLAIKELLERSGIKVGQVLSKNLSPNDLYNLYSNKYFIPLSWENLPLLEEKILKHANNYIDIDIPLPVGIANTERWLLAIAEKFNKLAEAKRVLLEDKEIVSKQLKYNYNFSWLSTLFTEKTCSIYASSQFAVSLAMCLFYDLNIKPKIIAILAESDEAIEKSKRMLSEMAEYLEFDLLINPDYYTYIKHIKAANVDFAIGSIQDKPLCIGENIPHMSLAGYYFFNNFNFTPWPYIGIKGMLSILTELGFQMEKTFYCENYWKQFSYKPMEEEENQNANKVF